MLNNFQRLKWFDLHCDTLSACHHNKIGLYSNKLHIDLKRGTELADGNGGWTQVFACFVPDALSQEDAWSLFLSQRDILVEAEKAHPDLLSVLKKNGSVGKETSCHAILSVEGGKLIGTDIERIYELSRLDVALLTLVWNGENGLAYGASSEHSQNGLTTFGKAAITALEECGITIDISHLSDKGIDDVFSISKKPVVATHSNARTICNVSRNLRDDQLSHLIKIGGLCGINYYPPFMKEGEKDPGNYTENDLRRQLDHILELGGENILALGSDFDGASMPSFIPDVTGLYSLYTSVVEWYGEATADKIFFENALRFLNNKKEV